MGQDVSKFSKLKMKFDENTYRGVASAYDIKQAEAVLKVPLNQIITVTECVGAPVCKKMAIKGLLFDKALPCKEMCFMAVFLLTELYKKKEDAEYTSKYEAFFDLYL